MSELKPDTSSKRRRSSEEFQQEAVRLVVVERYKNPRTADEWEPYLAEKKREVQRLSRDLADAEAEINDRVYRLFDLTPDEIALLQREVKH
jgi:hypothetical protein